jgi:hypothetical protein
MRFLTLNDLDTAVNRRILDMITGEDESKLSDSEALAIGFVQGKLSSRYDLATELGRTGESRNLNLVRWMVFLTVYYLYNTVQDLDIPERVRLNYEDVSKEIVRIASGKEATDLKGIATGEGVKTLFQWGSSPKRSHNPFG